MPKHHPLLIIRVSSFSAADNRERKKRKEVQLSKQDFTDFAKTNVTSLIPAPLALATFQFLSTGELAQAELFARSNEQYRTKKVRIREFRRLVTCISITFALENSIMSHEEASGGEALHSTVENLARSYIFFLPLFPPQLSSRSGGTMFRKTFFAV